MWNVVGHERVVATLRQEVEAGRVPHALLLTGPAGVGKTRLAIELAKAVNCIEDEVPCQQCIHCRQIEAGAHPDMVLIERPEGKDSIAIQQVRELREAAALRPFQGRRKVYIIAGAEALTAQAADALLKTLEEPQPQVTIVLTASEPEALPATVVSRCRVLSLGAVSREGIEQELRRKGVGEEATPRLANLAAGSMGWAIRAAAQPKLVAQQEEMLARLSTVLEMDLGDRLELVESLATDRKDRAGVRRHLELMTLLGRDLLLLASGLPATYAWGEVERMLARQASRYSLAEIHGYCRKLRLAMQRIDRNVDPRLTLEALLVDAP